MGFRRHHTPSGPKLGGATVAGALSPYYSTLMIVLGKADSSLFPTVAAMIAVTVAPFILKDFLELRAQWRRPEELVGKAARRFRPAAWIYVVCAVHVVCDPAFLIFVIRKSHPTAGVWLGCALVIAAIIGAVFVWALRVWSSYVQVEPDFLEFRWGRRCHRICYRDMRSLNIREWYLWIWTDEKHSIKIPLIYKNMASIIEAVRYGRRMRH